MKLDGPKVAYLLRRREMKQRRLAVELGVPETDISHLLRGRRVADDRLIKRMADLLGVPVAEIVLAEGSR